MADVTVHPKISLVAVPDTGRLFRLRAADVQKATFYVQLIRGSDADKPENPTWAPVGPKLAKNLGAVFRWKNYWEVKRQTVTVSGEKAARVHLTREREVELKLL